MSLRTGFTGKDQSQESIHFKRPTVTMINPLEFGKDQSQELVYLKRPVTGMDPLEKIIHRNWS